MSTSKKALQLEIRRAAVGDEHMVSRLIFEAFEPFRAEYTPDAFAYTAATPDVVHERFTEGATWIAFDGDEPLGTVSGLPEEERYYIRSMAVSPKAQCHGIGQRLLEAAEHDARESGFKCVYLYTTYVLPAARPLYERNGFRVVRETPPEEWFGMGGIEMEKVI